MSSTRGGPADAGAACRTSGRAPPREVRHGHPCRRRPGPRRRARRLLFLPSLHEVGMEPLPAWGTGNLPEPPPAPWRNVLRVIGPGAVLLAVSVGAGEWLLGPAAIARYGTAILWITTASGG